MLLKTISFALSFAATQAVDTLFAPEEDKFSLYMSAQMQNYTDYEMILNGDVPSWVQGELVNASPTLFEIGKYTVNNYMDGFIRFTKYAISGSSMTFSSKVVDDTKYYEASTKAKEPQMMLFDYPEPRRLADHVPMMDMYWCRASDNHCDNIGIMPWMLPDKKTTIMTTDQPQFLLFGKDDLSTGGFLEFAGEKDEKYGTQSLGATHLVEDVTTGDTLGLFTEMDMSITGMKKKITFYRISSDDVHHRKKIGSIPIDAMNYYHSFGNTADFILFPEIPVTFDTAKMMDAYPVQYCFQIHGN